MVSQLGLDGKKIVTPPAMGAGGDQGMLLAVALVDDGVKRTKDVEGQTVFCMFEKKPLARPFEAKEEKDVS